MNVLPDYSQFISLQQRTKAIDCEVDNLLNLKELLIFDNEIDSIPDCIGSLINLEKLEIWSNPIEYVTPEIQKLT